MMIVQPARFAQPFACAIDPYAANRVFFLRGQGANGAKPSTDELGNALTWTGAAAIVTGASTPYGSALRIATPASDYVSGPRGTSFALPGDFTMRARVYRDSGDYCTIMSHEAYAGAENGNWVFRLGPSSVNFRAFDAGQTNDINLDFTASVPTSSWFEVEASRVGSTLYLLLNGTVVGSGSMTKSLGSTSNNAVVIARQTTASSSSAYYSDVTILKGVGAHTASYTPPSLPPC